MIQKIKMLLADESGATAIEYAVILGTITLAIVGADFYLGYNRWTDVQRYLPVRSWRRWAARSSVWRPRRQSGLRAPGKYENWL